MHINVRKGEKAELPSSLYCDLAPWESLSSTTLSIHPVQEITGFYFGLDCGAAGSSCPPHGDAPLVSPLFSSAVTLGREAAARGSHSLHSVSQMFNRVVGET